MKKAQILSAIALAFALGVVAPVAGVYAVDGNTRSSFGDAAATTATEAEVKAAISKIENYAEYVAYANLNDAIEAATANSTEPADAKTALAGDLNTLGVAYMTDANISALVNAAQTSTKYNFNNWNNLVEKLKVAQAVKNGTNTSVSTDVACADLVAAIKNIRSDYNFDAENDDIDDAITDAQTVVAKEADGTDSKVYTYTNMSKLIADIAAAEKSEEVAKNLYDTTLALTTGEAAIQNVKDAYAGATPIATLKGLATTLNTATKGAAYGTLRGTIATDKELNFGSQSGEDNLATLNTLKTQFKAAAGVELDSVLPTTPTDPTDPEGPNDTEKPGDADNKDDVTNPGNTGVISGTNGTASSTVAVVAGIATALTAAGAGVVAYRNARREA